MGIGLIAGAGRLPLVFREEATRKGESVITIGVKGVTDIDVDEEIPIGKVGALIKTLKKRGVKRLVVLGKFDQRILYTHFLSFDLKALKILRRFQGQETRKSCKSIHGPVRGGGF
ncbi:MAG: hypothetical protein Q9N34_06620 [Aquificota bacterium]|nr:hypothetical protein [Aquificota bacterium]